METAPGNPGPGIRLERPDSRLSSHQAKNLAGGRSFGRGRSPGLSSLCGGSPGWVCNQRDHGSLLEIRGAGNLFPHGAGKGAPLHRFGLLGRGPQRRAGDQNFQPGEIPFRAAGQTSPERRGSSLFPSHSRRGNYRQKAGTQRASPSFRRSPGKESQGEHLLAPEADHQPDSLGTDPLSLW